jgi:putative ABC transport system permease protein
MTMYATAYQFSRAMELNLVLRTDLDPEALSGTVRRLVAARDRDVPVEGLTSLERLIGESVTAERVTAITLTLFSAVALLLASIGLYGVLAYYVTQRTHEIGVRMALGAGTGTVLAHVLARSGLMVIPGLAIGLAGALAGTRLIEGMLYEVAPADVVSFAAATACLAAVAFAASAWPAWRAAHIDPVQALRAE